MSHAGSSHALASPLNASALSQDSARTSTAATTTTTLSAFAPSDILATPNVAAQDDALVPSVFGEATDAAYAAAMSESANDTSQSGAEKKRRAPPNPERTSKYRGVSWVRATRRTQCSCAQTNPTPKQKTSRVWVAQFKSQGKTTYLGLFGQEEDAAKAYDVAVYLNGAPNPRLNFGIPTEQELDDARNGKGPVGRLGQNGTKRPRNGGDELDLSGDAAVVDGMGGEARPPPPPPPQPATSLPAAAASASAAAATTATATGVKPASGGKAKPSKKSAEKTKKQPAAASTTTARSKAAAPHEDNKKENLGFFAVEDKRSPPKAPRTAARMPRRAGSSDDLFQPMPPTPFEVLFDAEYASGLSASAIKSLEFGLMSPLPPSTGGRSPLLFDRPLYTPLTANRFASPLMNFTPASPLPDFGASPLGASRGGGRKRLHAQMPFAQAMPGNMAAMDGSEFGNF